MGMRLTKERLSKMEIAPTTQTKSTFTQMLEEKRKLEEQVEEIQSQPKPNFKPSRDNRLLGSFDSVLESSSRTWSVTIPNWRPARDNQLLEAHWRVKHKLKSADKEKVAIAFYQAKVPKATFRRKIGLTIIIAGRQKEADPVAYHKSLADALVTCGMLVDDKSEWMDFPPVQFIRGEKGSPLFGVKASIITLTDIVEEKK